MRCTPLHPAARRAPQAASTALSNSTLVRHSPAYDQAGQAGVSSSLQAGGIPDPVCEASGGDSRPAGR